MKRIARSLAVVGLASLIVIVHASAQTTDPLVGTWELNLAKSTFSPGPAPRSETRIYEASGSDFKLTVKGIDANGKPTAAEVSYSVDGREHPIIGSPDADSQSITRVDALSAKGH